MKTQITIRFTAPAFHRWATAPASRSYLAQPHRHLFHVEVSMDVWHDDREVEFHDLLDEVREMAALTDCTARSPLPEVNPFMDWSCEHHARQILTYLLDKYQRRSIAVSVTEDGECGATLTHTHQ